MHGAFRSALMHVGRHALFVTIAVSAVIAFITISGGTSAQTSQPVTIVPIQTSTASVGCPDGVRAGPRRLAAAAGPGSSTGRSRHEGDREAVHPADPDKLDRLDHPHANTSPPVLPDRENAVVADLPLRRLARHRGADQPRPREPGLRATSRRPLCAMTPAASPAPRRAAARSGLAVRRRTRPAPTRRRASTTGSTKTRTATASRSSSSEPPQNLTRGRSRPLS